MSLQRAFRSFLGFADRLDDFLEKAVLTLLLGGMVVLAGMQIAQRNLLGTGFVWTDEFLRILVLWIALAGAVSASRADKHISIDALPRILPGGLRMLCRVIVDLFTAAVSFVAAWHGVGFVLLERDFGGTVLTGFPAWIVQAVIPLAFGLIGYRYTIFFFRHLHRLSIRDWHEGEGG